MKWREYLLIITGCTVKKFQSLNGIRNTPEDTYDNSLLSEFGELNDATGYSIIT